MPIHAFARAVPRATWLLASSVLLSACGRGDAPTDPVSDALAGGRFAEAWSRSAAAVANTPDSAAAWTGRARVALATHRTVEGVEASDRALELDPSSADAWLIRAYLDQARFRNVAAVIAADSARARAPDRIECVRAAGEMRLGGGMVGTADYDGAAEAFEAALALDASDLRVRFGLGKVLVLAGRRDEGRSWLKGVLDERPQWGEAHYLVGVAAMRERDWDGAASHFERAVECTPFDASAWFNRARCLDRLGRSREANAARGRVNDARERTERVRSRAVAWNSSANLGAGLPFAAALRDLGRAEEARRLARALTEDHPEVPAGWLELAEAALEADRRDEAMEAAGSALAIAPRNPRARLDASRAAQRAGDPESALAHARHGREISPEDPELTLLVASLLLETDVPRESLAVVDELLATGRADARGTALRGRALGALGRLDEAEGHLTAVLQSALRPEWLEYRARVRRESGRIGWAKDDLRLALEIDPHRRSAWEQLEGILREEHNLDEAEECRTQVNDIEASEKAMAAARSAWDAAPRSVEAARRFADALNAQGRTSEAAVVWDLTDAFGRRP